MYWTSEYHRNFKMGNKGNNYFYIGAGMGVDYYIHDNNRYDLLWQALRVPLGFKFLLKGGTEFFIEGTYYLGAQVTYNMGDDPWHDADGTAQWGSTGNFAHGFEAKAGLRFWFPIN